MLTRAKLQADAELLDYIDALDDVIGWIEDEASESDMDLLSVLRRTVEFLVDLREQAARKPPQ